jgi:hypothetical protein
LRCIASEFSFSLALAKTFSTYVKFDMHSFFVLSTIRLYIEKHFSKIKLVSNDSIPKQSAHRNTAMFAFAGAFMTEQIIQIFANSVKCTRA